MLIKLDDHYKKYTNGFAEHQVEGKTVSECMSDLCNRYPQLLVHLQDNDLEMCKKSGTKLNGEFLCDEKAPDIEVTSEDTLELTLDLPSGERNFIGAIVGAILMVVAVVMGVIAVITGNPALMGAAVAIFKFGLGMVVSGVIMGIIMEFAFTPESPQASIPELLNNSATYTFNGIQNTVAAGTAINIVYGKHRVGGHILNAYTTVEEETIKVSGDDIQTTSSYLYYQIGLSEGEIADVVDIEINKLPITFYNEVTTAPSVDYLRLGSSSQPSMPDFSKIMSTVSVGRKVLTLPDSKLLNTTVVFTEYQPMYGIIWDEHLVMQPQRYGDYKSGMYKPEFIYVPDYDYYG
jgi:predicted phage tail protein